MFSEEEEKVPALDPPQCDEGLTVKCCGCTKESVQLWGKSGGEDSESCTLMKLLLHARNFRIFIQFSTPCEVAATITPTLERKSEVWRN